jgi:hypothetical protein
MVSEPVAARVRVMLLNDASTTGLAARSGDERSVTLDNGLDAAALRELTESFKSFFDFPTEPRQQLTEAIRAVFDSWIGERAVKSPRRPGHGCQGAADGAREHRRILVLRGGLSSRRADRRPRAFGRLPAGCVAQDAVSGVAAARCLRVARCDDGGRRPAHGDPGQARGPLHGHVGHRVHGRGGGGASGGREPL